MKKIRPSCINYGCDRLVAWSGTNRDGSKRYRPYCWKCHDASYGKAPLETGVKAHKKDHCENPDCTSIILDSGQLDLDHKDGNRYNNTPENVQTLCKNCHAYKGKISGDYKKGRLAA